MRHTGIFLRGRVYWFRFQRNGKRQAVSLDTSDSSEAIRRARQVRASDFFAPKSAMLATILRFLETKKRLNTFSRATARVHGAALREFEERVGGMPVWDVKGTHVAAHYAALQSRVAETTAQIHMRAIKAFFSWCVKERACLRNPCEGLRLAKIDKPARLLFCTTDQREDLIDKAPNDDLRFILFCGFYAGMRKGEIIEARVGWFKGGAVHLENTDTFRLKDRDARFVPLAVKFQQFLAGYLAGKDSAGFALRPEVMHGKGTYRYDFHRPYNDYMASKGMRWVTAHVMRHSFASLLVQNGVSVFKVANWLGDGVEVVQRHYAHLSPTDSDIERL